MDWYNNGTKALVAIKTSAGQDNNIDIDVTGDGAKLESEPQALELNASHPKADP